MTTARRPKKLAPKAIPVPMALKVRRAFGLSQASFTSIAGHSLRSIASWEKGRKPYPAAEQRLRELDRLHRALKEVIHPEAIPAWMSQPNDAFNGLKPSEVIARGEIDRIWEMVFLMRHGVPG